MNNVTKFIMALDKSKYYGILPDSEFTPEELEFISGLHPHYAQKKLRSIITKHKELAIGWDSVRGQTIACLIDKEGDINFSTPLCYDIESNIMTVEAEKRFPSKDGEKGFPSDSNFGEQIQNEIESIKGFIAFFFPGAVENFK